MALSNDDLLTRFEAEHFERNSISQWRRWTTIQTLKGLAARLDGTLAEVTPSDLMAWQGSELKRGLKPNTVRNLESMLRAFIGWAYTAEVLSFERMTQLKSVTSVRGADIRPKPRPYKRHELERFRELLEEKYPLAPTSGKGSLSIKQYLKGAVPLRRHVWRHAVRLQYEAQVSLALEQGLRRIEIYELTIPRMHFDNVAVVVRTAKGRPGECREREVPFSSHSRQCVREWLEFRRLMTPPHDRPWLCFVHANPTDPMSPSQMREAMGRFEGNYTWHRWRHTFATERLRAGMPLEQVQLMLGHSRMEQSLAYAQIVSADVRKEASRTEGDFERAIGVAG